MAGYGDRLAGKTVVDITNPVNQSFDGLVTPPDGSAARSSLAAHPAHGSSRRSTRRSPARSARDVAGQPLDVFIAGDDTDANATVAGLVRDGGLNPIDAGPLKRARELEAMGLLHMALQGSLGTGFSSAIRS